MVSIIVFLLTISSGCVLGAMLFGKHYEVMLPISCTSIVVILFIAGVLGILKISVILLLLFSVVIYIYAAIILRNDKKRLKEVCANFFSNGFFVFAGYVVVCVWSTAGRYFTRNDEFSHWGDIVKVMVMLDDYGTNPLAESLYQTYPPGMSLFQYFLQKIYMLMSEEAMFSEWRCFLAYQILAFAFVIPIFSRIKSKRIMNIISIAVALFLLPTIFYQDYYYSTLIDPFLGIQVGAGWSAIFGGQCRKRYF